MLLAKLSYLVTSQLNEYIQQRNLRKFDTTITFDGANSVLLLSGDKFEELCITLRT